MVTHLKEHHSFLVVLRQVLNVFLEKFGGFQRRVRQFVLLAQHHKLQIFVDAGQANAGLSADMMQSAADHPDVRHAVADLADELPELIEKALAAVGHSQLFDVAIEDVRSVVVVHLLVLVDVVAMMLHVLGQTRLDALVKNELREGEELLAQELVNVIHRRVDDTRAVSSQRVGDVPDVDGVQVLVLAALLDEDLIVQVVVVAGDEQVNVPHDLQHVQALVQRLRWQMIVDGLQRIFPLGEEAHLAVRPPILQRNRRQVVKHFAQVMLDVIAHGNVLVADGDRLQSYQRPPVFNRDLVVGLERIKLVDLEVRVEIQSQVDLDGVAELCYHVVLELPTDEWMEALHVVQLKVLQPAETFVRRIQ